MAGALLHSGTEGGQQGSTSAEARGRAQRSFRAKISAAPQQPQMGVCGGRASILLTRCWRDRKVTFSVGRGDLARGTLGLDRGRDRHGQGPKGTPVERGLLAQ